MAKSHTGCPISAKILALIVIVFIIVAAVIYFKNSTNEGFFNGGDTDLHLVMFKASWCGYCQKALPTYKEIMAAANGALVGGSHKLFFDIIDPDLDQDRVETVPDPTGMKLKMKTPYANSQTVTVKGYPTYMLFGPKGSTQYNGPLDRDSIMAFASTQ